MTRTAPGLRTVAVVVLILLVSLAANLPTLGNGFTNWDDPGYVIENPAIRSLAAEDLLPLLRPTKNQMYHPLTMLSYAIDYRLFGLDPRGYHAVNLALHLANTALAFDVLFLLAGNLPAAAVGALLFGIHPVHVESVAWISERKDVLSAFFFFAALAAYVRFLRNDRRHLWYGVTIACLVLSLFAKPTGVTFPLVTVLCDRLKGRPPGWRWQAAKLPIFLVPVPFAFLAITTVWQNSASLMEPAYGILVYARNLLLPVHLSALYPRPLGGPGALPLSFRLAPALLLAVVGALIVPARRSRIVFFGLMFALVTLLPVLQIVSIGGPHVAADRYLYIPSLGVFLLAGTGLVALDARLRRGTPVLGRAARAGAVTIAAALCFLTWERAQVWRDSLTLWNDVIARHPEPSIAYVKRGSARTESGDPRGGIEDISFFLAACPLAAEAYVPLGNARQALGESELALRAYSQAIALNPGYAEAFNNRGAVLGGQGKARAALEDFDRALAIRPDYTRALHNRSKARAALGDANGTQDDRAAVHALGGATPGAGGSGPRP